MSVSGVRFGMGKRKKVRWVSLCLPSVRVLAWKKMVRLS